MLRKGVNAAACSLAIVMLWTLVPSCNSSVPDPAEVVATAYGNLLMREELAERIPEAATQADSARIAEQYIKNWVLEQALLKLADDNLSAEQKDVQKQLDEYRNSLIIYAYERAFTAQKLDTIVSTEELDAYYDEHKQNFRLRSYIVKLRFVKLDREAPKQREVERWLLSNSDDDYDQLYDYCRKYAENFYLDDGVWLYLEEVMKEVPFPTDDLDNFFKQKTYYTFADDEFRYLVRIFEYRIKGDIAPLAFEQRRIRDFILNKRKTDLLAKMREEIVIKGLETGNISINQ